MIIRFIAGDRTAAQPVRLFLKFPCAELMRDRLTTDGFELDGVGCLVAVGLPME